MKFKLTEQNPIFIKYQKLAQLADDLGIFIISSGHLSIVDVEDQNKSYYIEDVENNRPITSFPYEFESKLTFEKNVKSKNTLNKEKIQQTISEAKDKGLVLKKNQFSVGWTIDLPGGYYLATDDEDMINYVKGY